MLSVRDRLATTELSNAQGRADLLAVAVASALLISALSSIDLQVRFLVIVRRRVRSVGVRARHSRDAQVRDRETVRLAGVEVDEVAAPPAVTAVVRWAARSIMQGPTARRDAGGQRQRARRALP